MEGANNEMNAAQLVKEINKELNYNGAAYYEIPSDPDKYPVENRAELQNLISQYLLLFPENWTTGQMTIWNL